MKAITQRQESKKTWDRKRSMVLVQGQVRDSLFDQFEGAQVVLLEGRPALDGLRVSCDALLSREITPTVISDNMAGFLFYQGLVKEAWVAYRSSDEKGIVGDIGALIVSVLARRHEVPVYAYPARDADGPVNGIEQDLLSFEGIRVAPEATRAYVPLTERVAREYLNHVYDG